MWISYLGKYRTYWLALQANQKACVLSRWYCEGIGCVSPLTTGEVETATARVTSIRKPERPVVVSVCASGSTTLTEVFPLAVSTSESASRPLIMWQETSVGHPSSGHNIFRGESVKFRGVFFKNARYRGNFAEHCLFHYNNKSLYIVNPNHSHARSIIAWHVAMT